MDTVRVLWLIKGLGLGGAERLLCGAAGVVCRGEFEVEVAYLLPWKSALVGVLEAQGVRVTCLGARFPAGPGGVRRLARLIRERGIGLVHAHLPWAGIAARLAGRMCGVPVVYTEHGLWGRLHPVTRALNRATLGWNALTIAVSEEVRGSMPAMEEGRLVTVPNGIDCRSLEGEPDEGEAVRRELGIGAGEFVIGKVANLSAVKRHEVLLRAFAEFSRGWPASRLVLVGQPRDRQPGLERLAADLGVAEKVVFTGARPDAVRVMRAFDVFAMSSESEGLPVSLLEAMAVGRPVVCTSVGGIPGVVRDGIEGFLVPAESPELMAARFAELARDAELRSRMGEAGRRRVREGHDVSVMMRAVEECYRKVLNEWKESGAHRAVHA